MRDMTCRWAWRHGWRRLAWAMNPRLSAHLLAKDLEEKRRKEFWEG